MFGKLDPNYSAYPNQAGKTFQWDSMDSDKVYNEHYQKEDTRSKLQELGWTKKNIKYSFNSYGFRCNEFKNIPNAIFLGCSYTMGVGLPLNKTFSQIVADELNLENYNLGVGGGSNSSAFRFGSYWIPKLKPKYVFLMGPNKYRFEIMNFGGLSTGLLPGMHFEYNRFYRKWTETDINSDLDKLKNHKALEQICNDTGSTFISLDFEDDFFKIENDYARDLSHSGVKSHQKTAQHILNKIKKLGLINA